MKRLLLVMFAVLFAGMAHATPQSSRPTSGLPAASSTSGTRPKIDRSLRSAKTLDSSSQTAYYGAPYYDNDAYYDDGSSATVSEQVAKDWATYQRYWGVSPYGPLICSYAFSPSGNGPTTGFFGGLAWEGQCGGGDGIYGTAYPYDPGKNNGCSKSCQAGDPINVGTGNEYEDQQDYSAPGSLTFERYYNSSPTIASTNIGAHWRDNFDRSIEYLTGGGNSTATVFRQDGKQLQFQKLSGVWTADPDIDDTLVENDNAQGQIVGWTYFVANTQQIENYNASGQLTSIQDLSGQVTTLTYSTSSTPTTIAPAPNLLITVTDPTGRQLNFIYNASSQITQITLPGGTTLKYAYDTSDNMTQVTYPDGHKRAYKYDESSNAPSGFPNLLTGIIDENGNRYADIHYDSQGRATSSQLGGIASLVKVAYGSGTTTVTWPLGVQSTLGFAIPYGRMRVSSNSQPCAPSCNQTAASEAYDPNGNPQSSTDFNGVTTAYTYDSDGLETQRIEAQGTPVQRTINTTWDTVWRNPLERTVINASGTLTAQIEWLYNTHGQVLARCEEDPTVSGATGYPCANSGTPPAGVRRWVYTYCDAVGANCPLIGLLLSMTGPRTDLTQTTTYSYYTTSSATGCGTPGAACYQAGDLHQLTDALGHKTTYVSYDASGRPTRITDKNGIATDMTYTARGWLHTRASVGAKTTITYDAAGNVTKVTQPDGVFTSYGYDPAHRLTTITDALGNDIKFTLDAAGDRIAENTYASGSSTTSRSLSRQYNTLGQLVENLDAYSNATFYKYDPDGNRTDSTDPYSITTHSSFDALNRLAQTIQNYQGTGATANTTTTYGYDSNDNLTQVTDPNGLNTNYTYDGLKDLGVLQSPDTGTSGYTYDAVGNRITKTDARGVVSTYTYDALDRLTGISYPTPGLNVYYYYDQPNAKTGCAKSSFPIGRLTGMVDASGSTSWCYDVYGNVVEKIQFVGTTKYTTFYTYNGASRLTGVTYPDGATITYTRDAAGHIATVTATPVGGVATTVVSTITYLPFGPATGYSFAGGGQALDKLFDANYRATDIEGSDLNLHFKLDEVGNITAEGNAPGVPTPNESYLYDPLYRLLQVDGSTGAAWQTYSYDGTGDRLSKVMPGVGTDTYSYTPNTHHLIGISGYDTSSRAMDANGNTTAFQASGWTYGLGYNDTNRLALVQQNGSTIATYGLNGVGERVAKTLAGGGTRSYVYDEGGRLLGEYATGQSRDDVYADGTLIAILDNPAQGGDTIHYVYTDNLGTPRAVTTQAGTLVWDWPYNQNPFGEAPASGSSYTLNLRYPGQYFDQEDGLNYNYYRDYEPATGRYAQSDPTGLYGGISTYAYAGSSPLEFMDPTGRNVTMTCRPLSGLGAIGIDAVMHCSVIVWHYEKDPCTGDLHKVITAQFSMPGGYDRPTKDPTNDTYRNDRAAFQNPTDVDENYDIAPPNGVSQSDFDNRVTQWGNGYSQGSYWITGPNSNSSAADIIAGAGGVPPPVPGAVGEYYYLMPRF